MVRRWEVCDPELGDPEVGDYELKDPEFGDVELWEVWFGDWAPRGARGSGVIGFGVGAGRSGLMAAPVLGNPETRKSRIRCS